MPVRPRRSVLLLAVAAVVALIGLAMAGGGVWLIALGGSWYYALAGIAMLGLAWLLAKGRPSALWLHALLVVATLAWALWEVGLDWWALAPRGDLVFLIGLVLLLPWITRRLVGDATVMVDGKLEPDTALSRGRLALAGSLALALAVGVASWFTDPHDIEGTAAAPSVDAPAGTGDVPPGEWHSYGRTAHGQRFSPLAEITPANVGDLEVAWTYNTGDISEPGDPTETTFQVTPLKIGDRLFLCTPHQNVIALDADTGEEIWRVEPDIQGELALQHLTCRGLAYHVTADAPAEAEAPAAPDADAQPAAGVQTPAADDVPREPLIPNAPEDQVAAVPEVAEDLPETASCPARLFMPTADGRLLALNPEDGSACTDFGDDGQLNLWTNMPNVKPGAYYSTSPVVVTRDRVIVGGTVLDNVSTQEASGVIRGYDVTTGELVWAWDSGNPDRTEPLPEGETYTPNSPNSWSISSVDEELGLVYVPLGNQPPDQWGGDRSEAVERFSSSVVALDVATGEVRWVFQTVHHDLWDYDVPSQPSLVDMVVDGETVPALVQPTKQGDVFVLDRRSGEPILPVEEVPAPQGAAEGDFTAPTQPVSAMSFDPPALTGAHMWGVSPFDQLACRIQLKRLRYEGRYTPPSTQGSLVYPGNFGVFNWGSVAVDPTRQIVLGTPAYLAFTSKLVPREDDTSLLVQGDEPPEGSLPALNENLGAPFAVEMAPFLSWLGLPCQQPPWGYVSASDLTTGETIWMHRNGTVRDQAPVPLPFKLGVPDLGGPLATASGLMFMSGTLDYFVRAYDVTDGAQLWEDRLPAGGQATPMTYLGRDGRQYLLVIAGGHGSLGTKRGDHVIAYALPRS